MRLSRAARRLPGRLATGAYILHTGLEKWSGDEARAAALHKTASNAFPFLRSMEPKQFLKLLSAGEIAVGAALLTPFVPTVLAGAALTAFSASLVTMYLRTPSMHKPRSVWPSQTGVGVSKDVWMLGIGVGLIADAVTARSAS